MGIDGIGKGRGATPPDASGGASGVDPAAKPGEASRPFEVARPEGTKAASQATAAGAASAAGQASPLARLRAGEIDVHGYVDLKVEEATKDVAKVPGIDAAALAEIKRALREQIASDPGLADLVRTATGSVPKAPED